MYSDKVLITGASGVIGRALEQELEKAGYMNVVSISSAQVDLRNQSLTEAFFEEVKPKIVYHLAARVYGIMGNLQNKGRAYLDNVRINTNVVDASQKCGVKKIIAMGSSAIYSDNVILPMSEDQVWNGAPHYSEAPYAHSKRSMLAHLEAYKDQYDLDYAFCISTNLYGPYDKFDEKWGHVIPSLISKFYNAERNDGEVSVWGTGKAKRDFLFSDDAAYAMRMIAESFTGPINLATGMTHTIYEVVEMLSKISNLKRSVNWDSSKPDGQYLRDYDVSNLRTIGFSPRYNLFEGLEKTYTWYKENNKIARC
ncbi:GDP-L-fucose synthase family protein [Dickeya undicola]|uniref:GDP-L-fucose synthase family protein n=1 Tax=Dickeya undicola TaxID=1577887 RepID=UPI000532B365|nr:GDP-L-fucose synthase [Dickeya undicola]